MKKRPWIFFHSKDPLTEPAALIISIMEHERLNVEEQ
jgi:hypothetical protein